MPFITTKTFDRAVRKSGQPLYQLGFLHNLCPTQISRALRSHSFGPTLAERFENLGVDLGVDPADILIEIEADR